jgi:hypothetical protein
VLSFIHSDVGLPKLKVLGVQHNAAKQKDAQAIAFFPPLTNSQSMEFLERGDCVAGWEVR